MNRKQHPNTPKVFITYKLLAAIMCLLSGREPIGESKELEDLSDSYGFDQYFYIDMDEEGRFRLFLAEKHPTDSPLWEIMDDYTSSYQKDTLLKEDKLKDKSSLFHPINVLDFKKSEEKTRIYLTRLLEKYGDKFYIDFFNNPFSEDLRWLECIWILGKEGELKFKDGYTCLTEKFIPMVGILDNNHIVVEHPSNKTVVNINYSDFRIENDFIYFKNHKLNLVQNGEDFKILRTLLLKKRAVRYEELWKELHNVYPPKDKNKDKRLWQQIRNYIKDHVCKIRKVIKKHGFKVINKNGYLEITK